MRSDTERDRMCKDGSPRIGAVTEPKRKEDEYEKSSRDQ